MTRFLLRFEEKMLVRTGIRTHNPLVFSKLIVGHLQVIYLVASVGLRLIRTYLEHAYTNR